MKKMMVWFQQALWSVKNEKGTVALEYALFAALITVVIIASLQIISPAVQSAFEAVAAAFPAAPATP